MNEIILVGIVDSAFFAIFIFFLLSKKTKGPFKVSPSNWRIAIIFPLIFTILAYVFFRFVLQSPVSSFGPLAKAVFVFCVIVPIAEEFLFRGMILGGISNSLVEQFAKIKKYENLTYIVGAVLVSLLFAVLHLDKNATEVHFYSRFVLSMIASSFYLLDNKNLLPAILAHSTWNFLEIISSL